MKAIVKFNTLFVTSNYDIETLKKVKKFRPDALTLYKGEGDDKEPVCAIIISKTASANDNGICFATDSITAPKVATMAIEMPSSLDSTEKINEWIRDRLGLAIVNCSKIEDQIAVALDEIAADEDLMNAAITIEGNADASEDTAQ